jgi:O-antigen/teichoic acid export membrane protein
MRKQSGLLFRALHVGIGTLASLLIGFISTPLITRLFSPDEYGLYSLFVMYGNMVIMVLALGMDQALVRFYYDVDTYAYRIRLIKTCVFFPFILSFIVCLGISVIWIVFDIKNILLDTKLVLLFSLYILVLLSNRFLLVILRLENQTREYAIVNIVQKTSFVVLVLLFGFLFSILKSEHLCMALVIAIFFSVIIALAFIHKNFGNNREGDYVVHEFSQLFKYAYPLIFTLGLTTIFQALDRLFIQHYYGVYEVGIYASAMSIIHVFEIVQTSFTAVWMPNAIETYSKNKEEKEYYIKVNETITIIMFCLGAFLILFKDIIVLLLGEKYREASALLPFLAFSPIMYTLSETTVVGLVFLKKSKLQIVAPLTACAVNFVGNSFLVPRYGCSGAAISTGISYIVFMIIRTVLSEHYYHIGFNNNKTMILIVGLIIYAWYASFYNSTIVSICLFGVIIFVILALYKKRVEELLKTCTERFL